MAGLGFAHQWPTMPPNTASGSTETGKSQWSPEEDDRLRNLVQQHGVRNWSITSISFPGRSAKSCHQRWLNQLSPEAEHRPFTAEEDDIIIKAHAKIGKNQWAAIARRLDGRTENAVKNRWNSLKRKSAGAGEDRRSQVPRITETGDVSAAMVKLIRGCDPDISHREPDLEEDDELLTLTLCTRKQCGGSSYVKGSGGDVAGGSSEFPAVGGGRKAALDPDLVAVMKEMIRRKWKITLQKIRRIEAGVER